MTLQLNVNKIIRKKTRNAVRLDRSRICTNSRIRERIRRPSQHGLKFHIARLDGSTTRHKFLLKEGPLLPGPVDYVRS